MEEKTVQEKPSQKEPIFSKNIWNKLYPYIKECLIPTGVITAIWLVLGWLGTAGFYWGIFRVAAFLTGAYNGTGAHFVGGTVGKALYVMCVNNLIINVTVSKKSPKEKWAAFWGGMKSNVLEQIPQYENLSYFWGDKDPVLLGSGMLGAGAALLIYPFITSGGALVNASVCLLLAAVILKSLASDSGLIMAIVHLMLKKKPFQSVRRDLVDRLIAGLALGMALSVVVAMCSTVRILAVLLRNILPWILVLGGLAGIFFKELKIFYDGLMAGRKKGGEGK